MGYCGILNGDVPGLFQTSPCVGVATSRGTRKLPASSRRAGFEGDAGGTDCLFFPLPRYHMLRLRRKKGSWRHPYEVWTANARCQHAGNRCAEKASALPRGVTSGRCRFPITTRRSSFSSLVPRDYARVTACRNDHRCRLFFQTPLHALCIVRDSCYRLLPPPPPQGPPDSS